MFSELSPLTPAQTIFLTILASASLVITYRYAVRPVLLRHNIIPLQHLPSTISQHISNRRRGHVRLPSEDFDEDPQEWNPAEGRLNRDLEAGFGVYQDGNEEGEDESEDESEEEGVLGSAQSPVIKPIEEAERETLL